MNEIGKLLKATREKQKLSLEDVAQRTKIHIYKLKAIEEGVELNLPAKVFAIGLIKSYARELKLDPDRVDQLCLQAFPEEIPETEEPPQNETNDEPVETQSLGLFQVPKAISIGASVLVSLALIALIFWVVNKLNAYSKEEQLHITDFPTQRDSQPAPETPKSVVKKKKKKSEKTKPSPKTSKPKVKAQDTAIEKIKARPKETPTTTTEAAKPTPTKNDTVKSDNKLVILSLSPVRLEIRWDDGYVQVMLLKSKETKTLVFSSPIQVKVNNGGAVRVSFNNSAAKIPGRLNQPVELNYP